MPAKPKYCIECVYSIQDQDARYTDTNQTAFCGFVLDPVTRLPTRCETARIRTDTLACGPGGRHFEPR